MFERLGAKVIDSDKLAHEVYADPDVRAAIREWWGDSVFQPSGEVDRRAIAGIVFSDADALRRLEALLYPRIESRRRAIMHEVEQDPGVSAIVIDAPKLFEAGVDRDCDAVVFVEADQGLRRDRVSTSRGWDEEELNRRERSQAPLEEKRSRADYVVTNNADSDELRRQIDDVLSRVLTSCGRPEASEE